ncbi:unnamed protein product, partial [Heterosigma akashiwo]
APPNLTALVAGTAVVLTAGMQYYNGRVLREETEYLLSADGLNHMFEMCYASELAEGDEHVAAVWRRVRDGLKVALTAQGGPGGLPRVAARDLDALRRILEEDVPALRRLAAPAHFPLDRQLRP